MTSMAATPTKLVASIHFITAMSRSTLPILSLSLRSTAAISSDSSRLSSTVALGRLVERIDEDACFNYVIEWIIYRDIQMRRISSKEFQQEVDNYSDEAVRSPVIITRHDRDSLVLMSIQEFQRLKDCEEKMRNDTDKHIQEILATHSETLTELAKR